MALGDPYITLAELKSYMGLETSEKDAIVQDSIDAAQEAIDEYCKRQFNDAGQATARKFSPNDPGLCFVDDFHTEAGFLLRTDDDDDGNYESQWGGEDYELRPLNALEKVPARPLWQIYAVGNQFRFRDTRHANVQVTARWGWAAVPSNVRQAAFILGSDNFQLKDSRLGLAGSDQFGQIIRVRDNKMAESKLKPFRRKGILVA